VAARQSPRILVVDDDEHFLGFMHVLLTGEGYDVHVARTAVEAEERFRAAQPDLLICDLWMPDTLPFAILERFAHRQESRDIGIIVCTAAVDHAIEARERLAGCRADVMLKPFEIEDLLACITRVLEADA
jgi:two-component system response regulator MtrA